MAEDQDQERELPASERRIQQAREEGNIPRSRELSGGAILLCTVGLLSATADSLTHRMADVMRVGLSFDRSYVFDSSWMSIQWIRLVTEALWIMVPLFGLSLLLAIGCNVAVGGFILSGKGLTPDFSKINPVRGLSNIFSLNGLVELIKAIAKTALLGYIGYLLIKGHIPEFSQMMALPIETSLKRTGEITISDAFYLSAVFFVLVSFDVPYQLWRYYHGMRMSLEELKREAKESEGDPHVKGRIRALQREAARKRMMSAIPTSDVVVTNPTHFSVALNYAADGSGAPIVVAKGRGELALKIRQIAAEHSVPTIEMPPLARALYKHVELEQEVPPALYTAVAKVLAYVYAISSGKPWNVELPKDEDIPEGMDPGVPAYE